jgi:uncharacterized membrane protein YidH (DUF202 family)
MPDEAMRWIAVIGIACVVYCVMNRYITNQKLPQRYKDELHSTNLWCFMGVLLVFTLAEIFVY